MLSMCFMMSILSIIEVALVQIQNALCETAIEQQKVLAPDVPLGRAAELVEYLRVERRRVLFTEGIFNRQFIDIQEVE